MKHRIIPIVLLDGFSVVKTIKFDARRNLGSPVTVMRTYNTRNVDEMVLLDIDASKQNRTFDKFVIQEITSDCFMPLTIGGGVRSCSDIEILLANGADKISVNSNAIRNISFVKEAVREFGSQCIVGSVDIRNQDGNYRVIANQSEEIDVEFLDWCKSLEAEGVGELLITDMSKDGTMSGPDLNLASLIAENTEVPVIFAGGVAEPNDALLLIRDAGVSAVGASSIFHFTNYTPEDCRSVLRDNGIPARNTI